MACAPLPATFIFARVAAESRGLKSQKIHVRKLGTFTKNLWACGAGGVSAGVCGRASARGRRGREGVGAYEELGVVVLEYAAGFGGGGFGVRGAAVPADALVV